MSSEPSTQLKPTSAVAGGIAADLADPVSPLSTPDQGTGTAVLERPETEEQTYRSDNGDVVARCGKIWVPKHDPSQYPVCPDCKRIYEEMMK